MERWSEAPDSCGVTSIRPAGDGLDAPPNPRVRPQAPGRPQAQPVQAMLLALATPCCNKSGLPHVHRTLPQAELFHQAIVGRLGRGRRVDCPELTGHDQSGQPLSEGHRHARVLPLDLDGDQHLDHVLIWAPMGLGDVAQRAIRSLKRTWTKGGVGDLQVALVGHGDLGALKNLPEPWRREAGRLLTAGESGSLSSDGSRIGAQSWISQTPFVPPRFVKRRGRNTIEGQINAELESRGLPTADRIELLPDESVALRHFVRVRRHGGNAPPADVGYALRIEFSEPVTGPIVLGYASHFGLGLFAAEETS